MPMSATFAIEIEYSMRNGRAIYFASILDCERFSVWGTQYEEEADMSIFII